MRQGDAAGAEDHLRRALDIWRPELGDHWRVHQAVTILAASISIQGRCEEAEPLLVASFEKLLDRKERTRRDAFERVREHFERCGKPQDVARFEAML